MKWRTCARILSVSLILSVSAFGCGGDDGGATEQPTTTYTPDPNAQPSLEFVANQSQTLQFGAATDLAVRYVDLRDSSGIKGAPISFELVGAAEGSKLGAMKATTSADGGASVSLTAGSANTQFTVKVSPPTGGGDPISFQVVVSDTPLGSIAVSMTYLGDLTLESLVPSVYRGVSCTTLDPNALPTPLMTTTPALASVDDTTAFTALDVASDYAVTVTAMKGPNLRAFGCVDGVDVKNAEETKVQVALADLDWPGPVLGTYDLDNQFDFGDVLPDSVQLAVDILDEFSDDQDIDGNPVTEDWGQDPGAFLSDFVMNQTCHWECETGQTYDDCSQLNHATGDISALYKNNFTNWDSAQSRFFGGCGGWETASPWVQDQINTQINNYIPAGVLAFTEMAGDLARAINKSRIYSELVVQEGTDIGVPMTHKLVRMEVLLHNLSGVENTYVFDLDQVGLTSIQTNANLTVDGLNVTIPDHEFKLSYGKLVQYIYLNGLLPLFGYNSTAEMFQDFVDCVAVGTYLESSIGFLSADTYRDYCNQGIQLAGDAFDDKISGFIKAEGTLRLNGTCVAGNLNQNDIATTLDNGVWHGQWGEDSGGGTGNVSGTFTGALR